MTPGVCEEYTKAESATRRFDVHEVVHTGVKLKKRCRDQCIRVA